jgi:PAS domain S-box-containing protein
MKNLKSVSIKNKLFILNVLTFLTIGIFSVATHYIINKFNNDNQTTYNEYILKLSSIENIKDIYNINILDTILELNNKHITQEDAESVLDTALLLVNKEFDNFQFPKDIIKNKLDINLALEKYITNKNMDNYHNLVSSISPMVVLLSNISKQVVANIQYRSLDSEVHSEFMFNMLLLLSAFMLILTVGITIPITRSIASTNKELEHLNENLDKTVEEKTKELTKQSNIVDKLVIYSQTNIHGIITDVSQAFVDLSGYTKDELIGQSHRIVRHPDSPKEVFEELWATINRGYEWHGIIKNRKKNGDYYIVNATMSPIFEDGSIVGYYSTRLDITEQEEYKIDLEIAKERAEESVKLKSEFLANMSHEIRTPMNGIIGMSHLALQTKLDETQKSYISKIDNSAKSLLGILNDILDFSKIEAGKLSIEKIDFDMFKVIDNIVDLLEFKAHEKNLEFIVDFDLEMGKSFYGDSLRIQQILVNLLGNAIKFTSSGEIGLYITKVSNDKVRFEVKDTGIGLTKEQQDKLFQSFSQADGATTRKYGGSGLGLSISKKLVELMGGKIWVESTFDIGSNFVFEIELEQKQDHKRFTLFSDKKILVVDDNQTWHDILGHLLEVFDIKVEHAFSGKEALDMIEENCEQFDLILMDWNMPNIDGIETTRLINKRCEAHLHTNPTVIMVSAFRKESIATMAKDVGIEIFLQKPINPSIFNDVLSGIFLGNGSFKYAQETSTKIDTTDISSLKGRNLLLVEDNMINQEIVIGLLENSGINIDVANNGKEAVDIFGVDNSKYDLILMDIQMPIMDGYEATKIIRSSDKNIAIIALSANAMKEDIEKSLAAGMNEHLNKPIDVDKLYKTLMKYIGVKKEETKDNDPFAQAISQMRDNRSGKKSTISEKENISILPDFKYIDTKPALKLLLGNEKLLLKVIKGLLDYKDINLEELDADEFKRTTHTIKGISASAGAMQLHKIAKQLDETQNKLFIPEFYKELKNVCEEIENSI